MSSSRMQQVYQKAMPVNIHVSTIWQGFLFAVFLLLPTRLYGAAVRQILLSKYASPSVDPSIDSLVSQSHDKKEAPTPTGLIDELEDCDSRGVQIFKKLYFELHNLERFTDILPKARDLLLSLLTETLVRAHDESQLGILSVADYASEKLEAYMQEENDGITREWELYVSRRRAGLPKEMFRDKDEAKWWLKQMAPVKYVDGAWLGHTNKVTTPFTFRRATKDAWQVMSEELGDGNPHMNHVYVYKELMDDIRSGLPEAHDVDFIHPRHQLNEECVWKAAVAQLLISLFPNEFLPEILGFNMHFEGLTMETMKAAKELEELGLNPYYFALHISIDNADSGHTAIAMHAVIKYLDLVREVEGKTAAYQAWKRVQAGYLLSKHLSSGPTCPSQQILPEECFPRNKQEHEIIKVFAAKAPVAHRIHCTSRIKMGGRKFGDWLEPEAFKDKQWQMSFLDHLSNLSPWVRKGDSEHSKLVRELSWGGKMFGSFTHSEVEVVKRWIDGLAPPKPQPDYWTFTGRIPTPSAQVLWEHDIRTGNPVLTPTLPSSDLHPSLSIDLDPAMFSSLPPFYARFASTLKDPNPTLLLPLWFTSPTLLESTISIPSRTTTALASNIVRLLRAQSGFEAEIAGPGVPGMDEARRVDSLGLVELGLEIVRRAGGLPKGQKPLTCLKEVLELYPSDFAVAMLKLSGRPVGNLGLLLGMSWAFVSLHEALLHEGLEGLLSETSQKVLAGIVKRERECLQACWGEIKGDEGLRRAFHRGCAVGRTEIEKCFVEVGEIEEDWVSDVGTLGEKQ